MGLGASKQFFYFLTHRFAPVRVPLCESRRGVGKTLSRDDGRILPSCRLERALAPRLASSRRAPSRIHGAACEGKAYPIAVRLSYRRQLHGTGR